MTYSTTSRDLALIANHFLRPETPGWTWVFYGDSITHGCAHTNGWRCFVEIFHERIRWELGHPMDLVINSGDSGYTSLNLLDPVQYDWQVRRFRPQVVAVLIGCNDIVRPECGGQEGFRARLAELVRRIRQDGAIPVLQTYNTMQLAQEMPQYVQRFKEFPTYCQVIREVAAAEQVILADHRRHWEEKAADPATLADWLGEPLHPGARGHWEMAMVLLKALGLHGENAASCKCPPELYHK